MCTREPCVIERFEGSNPSVGSSFSVCSTLPSRQRARCTSGQPSATRSAFARSSPLIPAPHDHPKPPAASAPCTRAACHVCFMLRRRRRRQQAISPLGPRALPHDRAPPRTACARAALCAGQPLLSSALCAALTCKANPRTRSNTRSRAPCVAWPSRPNARPGAAKHSLAALPNRCCLRTAPRSALRPAATTLGAAVARCVHAPCAVGDPRAGHAACCEPADGACTPP